jgi:hypothetical protein
LLPGFDTAKPKDGNDFAIAKFLVIKGEAKQWHRLLAWLKAS